MNASIKTFESLMVDALTNSLPDFTLVVTPPTQTQSLPHTRLGFEGAGMKAFSFLRCSPDFLQKTCPLPSYPEGHGEATLKDWLGELGNLILGRLKNRLLAHDVTIKISAPRFDNIWTKPEGAQTIAVWFRSEQGLVGFECVIEGVIPVIGEAIKQTAEILPGDAIYRLNDPVDASPSYDIISKIRSGSADKTDADDDLEFEVKKPSSPEDDLFEEPNLQIELPKASSKPIRILFHTGKPQSVLSGVSWSQNDKLLLQFSSGLEYTLCPRTLMNEGTSTLTVEGLLVNFESDKDMLRISIPKLNIELNKTSRVA